LFKDHLTVLRDLADGGTTMPIAAAHDREGQEIPVTGMHTGVGFLRYGMLAALGGSDGTLTVVRLMPD
jgi:hypothetical protein